jgi:hypothetical protein
MHLFSVLLLYLTGAVLFYESIREVPFTFEHDVGGNMHSVCRSHNGDGSPAVMEREQRYPNCGVPC